MELKDERLAEFIDEDIIESPDAPADEACEDEEQGMFEHFRLNVDKGQTPIRIDKYMAAHLEDTSRHRIQCAIRQQYVRVNGKVAKANLIVRPEDVIRFVMPYRRRGMEILPQDIPLDIVFEDGDLLVVNKAAGMVVHPGHGHFEGTLINALSYHLGISQGPEAEDERMGILVHRIDKDTSGLLVVAKNDNSQLHLARQFFEHSIERLYTAVVWGNIKEDEGTIDANIGRDPNDRLRFRVYDNPEKGKRAITHYKVLERFGFVTLVQCRLETGRTHQIRVHMSSIGHPLFNDTRYGGSEIRKGTIYAKYRQFIENCFKLCPRQALHAGVLGFVHPGTGQRVHFEAPLPEDMASLLDKWRRYCDSGNRPAEDAEEE
ncbi:MAG: RluA family pseudouridine synthase [Bacteroidia bacterium]|nr:RluA family pseudouridine synthase [Bacteroidia bacterium]